MRPFDQAKAARGAGGAPPAAHVASAFDCQGRNPLDRPNPVFPKTKNPDPGKLTAWDRLEAMNLEAARSYQRAREEELMEIFRKAMGKP